MKYWNNSSGWQKVVRYLKKMNYDVYAIDKDEIYGTNEKWNKIPDGAINETGNYPIEYRIQQIKNCSFFIGLSSGLSWLAWALNKKVIMRKKINVIYIIKMNLIYILFRPYLSFKFIIFYKLFFINYF